MAEQQPIIVIRKIVKGGHAHHGGAWKVAYADFVTAMMAFFLLLWLLSAVSQDQLEGISNYFAPVSVSQSTSGSGGVLGGTSMAPEGAMQSTSSVSTVTMDLPPPQAGQGPQDEDSEEEASEEDAEQERREIEEEQFREVEEEIMEALESLPELEQLAKSLKIDSTPEGLRIQIIDQEGLAMFARGSSEMLAHTKKAIGLVAKVIEKMPQSISITGYTDATKFTGGRHGYTNWELSADRANTSRRVLIEFGLNPKRLSRVVGAADQDLYVSEDPKHASNRRIAIVLLRGTGHLSGEKMEPGEEVEEEAHEEPQEEAALQ
jgi:chemotaxis protein MotB